MIENEHFFLGIDPGYARLGVGIVKTNKNNNLDYIFSDIIETPANERDSLRLLIIEQELTKLLNKYSIEFCAIESVFIKKNMTTTSLLLESRGVILLTLEKFNIRYHETSPTALKKLITGYGKSEKYQMQTMIKKILKLEFIPKPDDAADAISLAISAWLNRNHY